MAIANTTWKKNATTVNWFSVSVNVWPCRRSVRDESNANSIPARWLDHNISIKRWLEPIKRAQQIWLNLVSCSHSCDAHHWPNSIFGRRRRRRRFTRKRRIGAACWRNWFRRRFSATSYFSYFNFGRRGAYTSHPISRASDITNTLIPQPNSYFFLSLKDHFININWLYTVGLGRKIATCFFSRQRISGIMWQPSMPNADSSYVRFVRKVQFNRLINYLIKIMRKLAAETLIECQTSNQSQWDSHSHTHIHSAHIWL